MVLYVMPLDYLVETSWLSKNGLEINSGVEYKKGKSFSEALEHKGGRYRVKLGSSGQQVISDSDLDCLIF